MADIENDDEFSGSADAAVPAQDEDGGVYFDYINRDFPYGFVRRGLACLRIVQKAIRYRSATTAMPIPSDCVAIGCRRIRYCRSCRVAGALVLSPASIGEGPSIMLGLAQV